MDKSIIFFSMHRSASTFQIDMLKKLANLSGKRHVHLDPTLETQKINARKNIRNIPDRLVSNFSATAGHIYGPHRRLVKLDDLNDYCVIYSLRDPRDVIVSLFYSLVYSHGPPQNPKLREAYIARSVKAKQQGINKYALEASDNIIKIYSIYKNAYNKDTMLLLTYEEMVTNFKSYLKKMLDWCELSEHFQPMSSFDRFKPPKEDIYAHKRQVTPGDHKRKLTPQTVNQLTRRFKPILEWLHGT